MVVLPLVYLKVRSEDAVMVDLSRPRDSCGKIIGGASKYCPDCAKFISARCVHFIL